LSQKLKVTPTQDGAIITVNGFNITITVKPTMEPPRTMVEEVKSKLAEHLDMLSITEEAEGIIVRPTSYLGRDKFASIAALIRELGGNYISAGKESRFIIPKG